MASYVIRNMPHGLISRAKAKARESGQHLDTVLVKYLETYAEHGNPQAAGARAVNENRTKRERSESARAAVEARWKKFREEQKEEGQS